MPIRELSIINALGMHARASAKFCKVAGSFPCEVHIAKGARRVNGKSIMGVLTLAAGVGSVVVIETAGDQEDQALESLVALINDRFGEAE